MKKNIRVLMLTVFAICILSSSYAQLSQDQYKEELLKQIAQEKQLIKEAAKTFLIDTLPGLMATDPAAADQALARYSGMFNTMDQEDFIYLLGHFYARMGENTKAISSFNSLLTTKLNEDARAMLNYVLYEQMISYLQNNNREAAKDFLRAIIFENFNIDKYYPTYLYIWSEMSTEDGNYDDVVTALDSYNQNREAIITRILPRKQQIIDKIDQIEMKPFFANPTKEKHDEIINKLENIKIELTTVYNELISMKGIIYLNAVVNAHKQEMAMLDGLKASATEFLNNEEETDRIIGDYYQKLQAVKNFSVSYSKQINVIDVILQRQYERYLANDPTLQDKDYSDMELKRLYDIEKSIEIYDQIITELDANMTDPALAEHITELQQRRAEFSDKRTDLQLRKEAYLEKRKHSSDVQEQIFEAILNDYYALNADEKDLDLQIAELQDFFANDAKDIFNAKLRQEIQDRVGTQVADATNDTERNVIIAKNAEDMQTDLEFIKLQLKYRNLRARENARLAKKDVYTMEQMTQMQAEILTAKRQLINEFEQYLSAHPNFKSFEQPDGNYLINSTDMLYNLAELQYDVNMNNPGIALATYRKVVSDDPTYLHKDAALYNIGFISSKLNRNQIDTNKERFYQINTNALALDANSKYKYSDFAESITAYQEIVDNYKNSEFYDESLYRLGVLNFYLATDADDPARYYALAANYFDEIIANPTSKYKYDAVYQRGWLRMNTAKDEDLRLAMADFLTLLNAVENNQVNDPMLAQDYRDDSVKNIAYCLIALDGLDFSSQAKGVAELQKVFAGYSNSQIINRVLDAAVKNKFDLDASLQAVDFIWLKINMSPLALENPSLLDSILYIYARQANNLREGKEFNQARQEIYLNLIDNYNQESAWYAANKDKNIAPQLAVINKAYTERGKRLYIEFSENPSDEKFNAYKAHMQKFGGFTQLHGDNLTTWQLETDRSILVLSTTLAEKSNLPLNYLKAISSLREFNSKYPEDEDYYNNEGLAYTYSNNIFNLMKDRYNEEGYAPEPGTPATQDELFTLLSNNSVRFIEVMRSEKFKTPEREQEAVAILLNLADIQYGRDKYPEATALYLKALEQESIIATRTKFDIYGKLALMAQSAKNYANAEMYYRKTITFTQAPAEIAAINELILNQIQLSYEAADASGNYSFAATERLRMASELPAKDDKVIQVLRWTAHESYVKAKEYQKAVDLLLEVAGTKTDIDQAYNHYYTAWQIAESDSMMNNPQLANTIKQAFINKYPSSELTYSLKVAEVKKSESLGSYAEAADAYLALHDQARAKSISIGDDTPDALMVRAIVNLTQAKNEARLVEVMQQFVSLYPKHERTIPYMEYIASNYYANGDTLKFEQIAKEIFQKDKNKSDLYKRVAELKLYKLYTSFDLAYKNKDFPSAFKARDDFKKLESAYVKEGLSFNVTDTYTYFAAVQAEYDNIQKQLTFLNNYDKQLSALEKSNIMVGSPASLISVNVNTRWQTNLVGGNKRIPGFKSLINGEINKVSKLIDQANKANIDLSNSRRLRAQSMIASLYSRGANVIKTQIGYYIKNSTEAADFRKQYKGDELEARIQYIADQQTTDLLNAEYSVHINIFNMYHMAGYHDKYTERSVARLQEWNFMPDYKTDDYVLNQSWVQKIEGNPVAINAQGVSSPNGVSLAMMDIPAEKTSVFTRMINTKIAPELALLHIVYPSDIEIVLNGTDVSPLVVPTDTLEAGKPISTRYAYILPKEAWAAGQNLIEIKVPNPGKAPEKLYMGLQLLTDRKQLLEAIPSETVTLNTGSTWKAIIPNQDNTLAKASPAIAATNFGIELSQIDGMGETTAVPIWVNETTPATKVTFEVEFNLDTEFKEGSMDFVAPGTATVLINGKELVSNIAMDYDAEPFMAYTSQATISREHVVNGKNVIQFIVENDTEYRGFIASVKIVKAGKEVVR